MKFVIMFFSLELGHLVLPVGVEDITIRSLQSLRHLVLQSAISHASKLRAIASYILPMPGEGLWRRRMPRGSNSSAGAVVSSMLGRVQWRTVLAIVPLRCSRRRLLLLRWNTAVLHLDLFATAMRRRFSVVETRLALSRFARRDGGVARCFDNDAAIRAVLRIAQARVSSGRRVTTRCKA